MFAKAHSNLFIIGFCAIAKLLHACYKLLVPFWARFLLKVLRSFLDGSAAAYRAPASRSNTWSNIQLLAPRVVCLVCGSRLCLGLNASPLEATNSKLFRNWSTEATSRPSIRKTRETSQLYTDQLLRLRNKSRHHCHSVIKATVFIIWICAVLLCEGFEQFSLIL